VDSPGYFHPAGAALQRRVRQHGVFLRPLGDVVYLLPPLCLTDLQLERCWRAIEASLD
jgi:adenosylmethionine-8-amino-7-oxononanoate aminotransferase